MSETHIDDEEYNSDVHYSDEQVAAIKEAADNFSASSDPEAVLEVLQTIPNSGVELMLQIRDRFGVNDHTTPLILSGILLNELASRIVDSNPS